MTVNWASISLLMAACWQIGVVTNYSGLHPALHFLFCLILSASWNHITIPLVTLNEEDYVDE